MNSEILSLPAEAGNSAGEPALLAPFLNTAQQSLLSNTCLKITSIDGIQVSLSGKKVIDWGGEKAIAVPAGRRLINVQGGTCDVNPDREEIIANLQGGKKYILNYRCLDSEFSTLPNYGGRVIRMPNGIRERVTGTRFYWRCTKPKFWISPSN